MKTVFIIIFFLITLSPHCTWAQLNNKQHIIHTMDYVYNFNFVKADSLIKRIDSSSNVKVYNFLKSQYYRWYYLPMHEQQGTVLSNYYKFLNVENEPRTTIDSLLLLNNKLLKAEYYYNNDEVYNAFTEAFSLYGIIESKLPLSTNEISPDWLLMVSLYHYYFDYYKEKNKLLAGMMWMLKNGDKEKGIEGLQKLATSNEIGKTEALIYLSHIYLRLENKPDSAYKYSLTLHQLHPRNKKFYELLIESSISANKYTLSLDPLIQVLAKDELVYYKKYGLVYQALTRSDLNNKDQLKNLTLCLEVLDELGGGQHLASLLYAKIIKVAKNKETIDHYYELLVKCRKYIYSLTVVE